MARRFSPRAALPFQQRAIQLLRALILAAICCTMPMSCGRAPEKTTLRVNLFPYLPDAASDNLKGMAARLKKEFELRNPSVTLEVKLSSANDNNFYDLASYEKWVTQFDVIEPDTVFLTDLVTHQLIEDWGVVREDDWQLPARNAAKVNGKVYAMPHWLCGFFLFSRDAEVARAKTLKELLAVMQTKQGSNIPEVAGNLVSSWDTPALYLDSWEDNHFPGDPMQAISTLLDADTIKCLKDFSEQCNWGGSNPCLDETYKKDDTLAVTRFANREVETVFGYSERLFAIRKAAPGDDRIVLCPLILGNEDHPLLFMDGFVLAKGRKPAVKAAALRFVEYMQDPNTYMWIIMSQDTPSAPPRYLMPATVSAFSSEPVKSDSYYKAIQSAISMSSNFPNSGLPELHTQMRDAILSELRSAK